METAEEADFARTGHFVGDAGEFVLGADDAVVCGVEVEFYRLFTPC
jgi:hypothetical protein